MRFNPMTCDTPACNAQSAHHAMISHTLETSKNNLWNEFFNLRNLEIKNK